MRIDPGLSGSAPIEPGQSAKTTGRADVGGKQDVLGVDETTLSADQSSIQVLTDRISQLPDVRAEKVEALRNQVVQGTYRVDANDVAEALARDLVGGNSQG